MINELITKVRKAEIEVYPFPHFKISNFLPEDLYKSLMETYPSYEEYFADGKTSSQGRKIIERNKDIAKFEKLFHNAGWYEVNEIINDPRFVNVLFDVYLEYFTATGCKYQLGQPYATQFDVSVAGTGYKRGPHLDQRQHLINNFFYLNSNEDIDAEGGELQLLSPLNVNLITTPDKFPADSDVTVAKTIPTEANSFVSFLPCSYSWHSVPEFKVPEGKYRKFIYYSLNATELEDAWPETYVLSEERRLNFISE